MAPSLRDSTTGLVARPAPRPAPAPAARSGGWCTAVHRETLPVLIVDIADARELDGFELLTKFLREVDSMWRPRSAEGGGGVLGLQVVREGG